MHCSAHAVMLFWRATVSHVATHVALYQVPILICVNYEFSVSLCTPAWATVRPRQEQNSIGIRLLLAPAAPLFWRVCVACSFVSIRTLSVALLIIDSITAACYQFCPSVILITLGRTIRVKSIVSVRSHFAGTLCRIHRANCAPTGISQRGSKANRTRLAVPIHHRH